MVNLEYFKVKGDFPMTIFIDRDKLPVEPKEIIEIIEENSPIAFSGQRTPVYRLSNGLFLRAKGFSYQKTNYHEMRKNVLDQNKPLSLERAIDLDLRMKDFVRPIPRRFKEGSGHYVNYSVNPDGTFKRGISSPRPIAAMTLEKALNEFHSHILARKNKLPVDLPLGCGYFEDFDFRHRKEKIPCGGFLAIIPSPYDLRILEIVHNSKSEEIRSFYGLGNHDISLGEIMKNSGKILREFHKRRLVIGNSHIMNVKIGIVDDEFKPVFQENDSPLYSICDLDSMHYCKNDFEFLTCVSSDIEEMIFFSLPSIIPNLKRQETIDSQPDDTQKYLHDLTMRVMDSFNLSVPTNYPKNTFYANYFDMPEEKNIIAALQYFPYETLIKSKSVKEARDFTIDFLKFFYGLDIPYTYLDLK